MKQRKQDVYFKSPTWDYNQTLLKKAQKRTIEPISGALPQKKENSHMEKSKQNEKE